MNFRKRISALRVLLRKEKLSAFVVVTHEGSSRNVRYLSGFGGTTGVLVVGLKDAVLAVDGRYVERAEKEVEGVRVAAVPRGQHEEYLTPYIRHGFEALGIGKGARVGFEGERVSVLAAAYWQKALPVKFAPTKALVERLRALKDAIEVRLLQDAARRTARAFADVERKIKAGMREREVARLVESALLARGASAPSFETIVASGPNSAMPHHATGERRLRAGEPVVIDFGGIFREGYCSDMTRTIFVLGKKPERALVEMYNIVLEANRRAGLAVRSGMTFRDYDAVARAYIKEKGYGMYFAHGLGHSLGLEVHDPYDYPGLPIRPGAVFTDEPGIYIPGLGGVRIEDTLVMGKKGARRLTPPAKRLVLR